MLKTLKKRNDLKNILFHLQNSDKRDFVIKLINL